MLIRSLSLALAIVASGCKGSPTLDGPCDSKQLASLREAIANVNGSDRALITTVGLGEACAAKLPSDVTETITAVGGADPADRFTIIAGSLGMSASFANAGCPDWENTINATGRIEPPKRAASLYAACKYERFDLLTVEELDQSLKGTGLAVLAVPMYAWLVEKNMQPAEAKRLARSMFLGEAPRQ